MTVIDLHVSTSILTDVQRRSFYARLTLFGRSAWVQYWPRPIAGKRFLTAGVRGV